jgi:hypothetical protein
MICCSYIEIFRAAVHILKYFGVHDVGRRYERYLAIDRTVCDHYGYVVGVSSPGESNVALAVGEDRRG